MIVDEAHREILVELRDHGPSRAADLCEAFTECDGWTVSFFVTKLAELAVEGLVEVHALSGFPFWVITEKGRTS